MEKLYNKSIEVLKSVQLGNGGCLASPKGCLKKVVNFSMKLKFIASILILVVCCSGCATGRNMTSPHYLADYENKIFNLPNPSETSGGYWAAKTARNTATVVGRTLLFPFAVLGNVAVNAYLIPTWPLRWLFRGDKRFIVWLPIFHFGEEVGSTYFSEEWNNDLT